MNEQTESLPDEIPAWKLKFFACFLLVDIAYVIAECIFSGSNVPPNATWLQKVVFEFLVYTPFYLIAFTVALAASGVIALFKRKTGKLYRETTWYRALFLSIPCAILIILPG